MRPILVTLLLTAAVAVRGDFPLNSAPRQPTTYSCSEPAIAALGDGHVVAWSELVRSDMRIHARFLDRDGRFGEDRIVDHYPFGNPQFSKVSLTSNGSSAFLLAETGFIDFWTKKLYRIERDAPAVFLRDVKGLVLGFGANDDYVLVVTLETDATNVTVFDRDGVAAGKPVRIAGILDTYTQVSVAPARGGFFLGWGDGKDGLVRTLFLTNAGILAGEVPAPLVTPAVTARRVQLAADAAGFLAVWLERDRGSWSLMVRRFSATGEPLSPPRMTWETAALSFGTEAHALAAADGGFVMFVTEPREIGYRNIFIRLDADGVIADMRDTDATDIFASIAARGAEALLVQQERTWPSTLTLTRIGADGAIGPPEPFALTPPVQRTLALYWTGNGWAAVWSENYDVLVGRFTAAGEPLDGDGIPIPTNRAIDAGVAFNGTALLAVWDHAGPVSAFIPLAEPRRMVVRNLDQPPSTYNAPPPAVVAAGRDFVAAWPHPVSPSIPGVRAIRVSGDDGLPRGAARELLGAFPYAPAWINALETPRLAWNGKEMLLTWQQLQHSDDATLLGFWPRRILKGDPFAQRVSPSLDPIGDRINVAQGPLDHTDFASLAVSAAGDDWLISWLRLSDFPALMSERLTAAGARRDVDSVSWSGDAVPVVAAGTMRAAGSRIDALQPDGRVQPLGDAGPAGAVVDAIALGGPLPAIAYSVHAEDGSERAWVRALTGRQRAAGRP